MSNNKFDVLFMGGIFPKEIEKEVFSKSKGNVQNAANNLQWAIINGLDAILSKPIKVLNMMFIGSYPRNYRDIIIKSFNFSHAEGASDYNIGFLNFTFVKMFSRYMSLKKPLKKYIFKKGNKKIVLLYSIQNLWLSAAKMIKKLDHDIHICIIVPDLPEYTNMSKDKNLLFKLFKKYSIFKCKSHIKYIDSFVFLTKHMKEYFNINKPFVVIEGMIDDYGLNLNYINSKFNSDSKTILYTGSLTKKYGVLDLVKAFMTINNDKYKLIICGDGEVRQEIIEYAKLDDRIVYKGLLEHNEVLKLQKSVTVLINPRKNNDEYTKYSFPSKIMEYLSSGTPVIAYKLDGIPDEYDDFIYYINGNSIYDMASKIVEVCEKSDEERIEFGKKALDFIYENKNNVVQAKKIINMFNESIK